LQKKKEPKIEIEERTWRCNESFSQLNIDKKKEAKKKKNQKKKKKKGNGKEKKKYKN